MNGRERYLATLKGEPKDFPPRVPILMQYAAEYIGSNYAAFASDYNVLVDANLRCAEEFGFDQVSCISDPFRETQGFGAEITYLEHACPRATIPLEDTKDLSVLKRPDPATSKRMLDRVKAAEMYKARCGDDYSILGWVEGPAAEAGDVRGLTNYMMDLVMEQEFACDLMDLCVEVGIEFARAQVQAGADTIGIGDAIASQVSPDTYESLILPREKILVDAIKDMGAFVKLHICGNISHLLDGIATLGVDIIDVDHMVSVITVREKMSNVAIAGNIDPAEGVLRGTPESIIEKMKQTYSECGDPYMPMGGCEIPPGTPEENLRALCQPIN